jgi:hypothetical protein
MKVFFLMSLILLPGLCWANASVKCKDGKIYPLIIGDIDPTPEAEKKCKDNKGVETLMIQATPLGGAMAPPMPKGQ